MCKQQLWPNESLAMEALRWLPKKGTAGTDGLQLCRPCASVNMSAWKNASDLSKANNNIRFGCTLLNLYLDHYNHPDSYRRRNVRGRLNASKVMLMRAATFNLKKWFKNYLNNAYIEVINCILILRRVVATHNLFLNNYCVIDHQGYHSDCQWNEEV